MSIDNNTSSEHLQSCPSCHSSPLMVVLMNGQEQCVMCHPNQDRTSNIHVSYLYLEVMTTMAIADCFLGDTCDTAVDYQSSII